MGLRASRVKYGVATEDEQAAVRRVKAKVKWGLPFASAVAKKPPAAAGAPGGRKKPGRPLGGSRARAGPTLGGRKAASRPPAPRPGPAEAGPVPGRPAGQTRGRRLSLPKLDLPGAGAGPANGGWPGDGGEEEDGAGEFAPPQLMPGQVQGSSPRAHPDDDGSPLLYFTEEAAGEGPGEAGEEDSPVKSVSGVSLELNTTTELQPLPNWGMSSSNVVTPSGEPVKLLRKFSFGDDGPAQTAAPGAVPDTVAVLARASSRRHSRASSGGEEVEVVGPVNATFVDPSPPPAAPHAAENGRRPGPRPLGGGGQKDKQIAELRARATLAEQKARIAELRDELVEASAAALKGEEAELKLTLLRLDYERQAKHLQMCLGEYEKLWKLREEREAKLRENMRKLGLWKLLVRIGLGTDISHVGKHIARKWHVASKAKLAAEGRLSIARRKQRMAPHHDDEAMTSEEEDDGEPSVRRWQDKPARKKKLAKQSKQRREDGGFTARSDYTSYSDATTLSQASYSTLATDAGPSPSRPPPAPPAAQPRDGNYLSYDKLKA